MEIVSGGKNKFWKDGKSNCVMPCGSPGFVENMVCPCVMQPSCPCDHVHVQPSPRFSQHPHRVCIENVTGKRNEWEASKPIGNDTQCGLAFETGHLTMLSWRVVIRDHICVICALWEENVTSDASKLSGSEDESEIRLSELGWKEQLWSISTSIEVKTIQSTNLIGKQMSS